MNSIVPLNRQNPIPNLLLAAGAALGIYWFALFLATHLPPELLLRGFSSSEQMLADGNDKVIHLIAYAGLSFLFASCQWLRGIDDRRLIRLTLVIPGLYAILDELLQIPVRRSADVMDCLADWCGVLIGLACFLLARAVVTQLGGRVSSAEA